MTGRRIVLLDAHPDPAPCHFVHALADAYADAARGAGHELRRINLGKLDFPLLRKPANWIEGKAPEVIAAAQDDLEWAEHLVIVYPLWLGDVPALLKGFLEQAMRPGFALGMRGKGFPKKLLRGRSARVVVTMGMPALFYRMVYRAHSLKSLERNILRFVGYRPVEQTVVGRVDDPGEREEALATMRELGARAA